MGLYIKDFIKSEDEFDCKWYEEVYLRPLPYCHFLRGSCRGAEKCPLVEVPEPHGRLGDLDALPWYLTNEPIKYASYEDWERLCDAIKTAPTVIPASEEG